jgi:hypothetical protein
MPRLDVANDKLSAAARQCLERLRRPATIGRLGGREETGAALSSWFGRVTVGRRGEAWPVYDGKPMLPLLQLHVPDLPNVPPRLRGVVLVSVFVRMLIRLLDNMPLVRSLNG